MPPEVWTDCLWTPRGDVFSLGVVMFQVFTEKRCFSAASDNETRDNTLHASPPYDAVVERWGKRCSDLQPLLEGMLSKSTEERLFAADCLSHAFFQKRLHGDNFCEDPI